MTELRPTGDWDGTGLAHEAFCFSSDAELVERVLPFVHEGFERAEPVLVVAGERVRELVSQELGDDVQRLAAFRPAEQWWRGGHATLHAYDRELRQLRTAVPTWRLAAEPVWLRRDDGREWSRFESVANRCYDDLPYYSLCLHDRRQLSQQVLDDVARTHPLTWGGRTPVPSAGYVQPERFLRDAEPAWTPRPDEAAVVVVDDPGRARRAVAGAVVDRWAPRADDVVLAVHELVVNGLGVADVVEIATWTHEDRLVLEVADAGPGLVDRTRGYVPPTGEDGRGLWLAWSLADDACTSPTGPGTRVRLFFDA